MIRRPTRSTLSSSSAASDVYKRQVKEALALKFVNGGWPEVQSTQKRVAAKKIGVQAVIRRLKESGKRATEEAERAEATLTERFKEIRRQLDAREEELRAEIKQAAATVTAQSAGRVKCYSKAMERFAMGITPPPHGSDFRNFCTKEENAEFLQAMCVLQDVNIDEASQSSEFNVDLSRVEGAIRVLQLGRCSFDGDQVAESYSEFLDRARTEGERHEAMHAVRVCGKDSAGNMLVQLDGRKLVEEGSCDLEGMMMHVACTLNQAVNTKWTLVLFYDRSIETLSLIHISEPTRLLSISYAVFCLKKKKTIKKHISHEA
eukprot:TRINITY_DN58508_c0_g1_i1.p1 TRINITY_DN58508_c0_g1~~TRINITY_DN58508_c0_g1_i1.p1  ORF type:complete len:318 (-),score=111.15 TRINITY_DN58508_c0_g1_i1:40-993(-)